MTGSGKREKRKKMTIDDFIEQMMNFFPRTRLGVSRHIDEYGERLDTIVIEDIIMPNVIEIIKKQESHKISSIFGFFEQVSEEADSYLLNIFSTTVLEILGNDTQILEIAKLYMGPKMAQYQKEADIDLGRIRED